MRKWAGVLDASPRDAFSALEADGCSYEDEDDEDDEDTAEAEEVTFHTPPVSAATKPIAMSKSTDAPKPADKPEASGNAGNQSKKEQPDEKARLAQVEAELSAMKAENKRLAEARRAASLASLRTALAGKVPGSAVEALVELAEAADKAASGKALVFEKAVGATPEKVETSVIDRLAAIASAMPELVTRGVIDTAVGGDGAGEEARAIAEATVKM